MAKKSRQTGPAVQSPFDEARDELFQHIMRCGVVGSAPIDQTAWFDETLQYMTVRFPELNEVQLGDLRKLGERFAQPPKRNSAEDAA